MTLRALSVVLAVISLFVPDAWAQEKRSPMLDVTAYAAVDGVLVSSQSPVHPFTLRVVGADPKRVKTDEGQLWLPKGEQMFQMLLVPIADVLPNALTQPGDREVLSAHADWECKSHNETLQLNQTVKPEFLEGKGRTWSHWTYDLTAFNERLKKEAPDKGPAPSARTQHLLTTVLGQDILVLIGTTFAGEDESDTMVGLFTAAKTLTVYPKPLAPQKIKDLCSQKQKP